MIWIIGNKGMLGSDVETLARANGLPVLCSDKETDICDPAVMRNFTNKHPGIRWIVNCSAYTAVDKAEDERDAAFNINCTGVHNLANLAAKINAVLVHISTDYVFNGEKPGDYFEDDPPSPLGVYGESKLAGEKAIAAASCKYYIIRTAWLYGNNGNNFVATMLRLFKERDTVKVVFDQVGNPTYTIDLANAILSFIRAHNTTPSPDFGIYHFTNSGTCSWYDFAAKIYETSSSLGIIDKKVTVLPIPTAEYPTKARRPKNSSLSKNKIMKALRIPVRTWQDALEAFLKERINRNNEKTE